MPPQRRIALPTIALVTTLSAALLAGCGETSSPSAEETTPESPATSAPPTSPPPSTPTTTAPVPETFDTPTDRLLPTADVPGLNDQWVWQDGETGPAAADAFGACARFDLGSIGATEVVERTWYPPDDSDDSAAQQIAEFPDTATLNRAVAVLRSWHAKCRGAVTGKRVKVGPITPVATSVGKASWYLVSWVPKGSDDLGRFHAFGTVADGTRLTVLRMDSSGQDYNYESGQEPMARMVRAAAPRLR